MNSTVVAETQQYASVATPMQSTNPPEWENISPNILMKCLKAILPDTISSLRIRDFYNSYPTLDALGWYHRLPEAL